MTGNKQNINNAVLYELAKKIHDMSKEERLGSLKKINRPELEGKTNRFWRNISKRMLANEELTNNILVGFQISSV